MEAPAINFGENLTITVYLIDDQTDGNAPATIRVLIGLLKVNTSSSTTGLSVMEYRSGWLIEAMEGDLSRPDRSKNSLSLELESR